MGQYFRPRKLNIFIFIIIVALNIFLPVLADVLFANDIPFRYLFYQIFGFGEVVGRAGFRVDTGKGGFPIGEPNALGLLIILISVVLTLTTYYVIACFIAHVIMRKKESGEQVKR